MQAGSKSNLSEMKKENKKIDQKSKKIHYIILKCFTNQETMFFDDYSSMLSEAKLKANKGTEIKILTPKHVLQRLPVALAQVKAGNNLKNLLNEIR